MRVMHTEPEAAEHEMAGQDEQRRREGREEDRQAAAPAGENRQPGESVSNFVRNVGEYLGVNSVAENGELRTIEALMNRMK